MFPRIYTRSRQQTVHTDQIPPWEPVWYPYSRTDTKARRSADIEPKREDGVEWVTPGTGGLLLFDAPVTFGLPGICLRVPSGTEIPAGLAISKDVYRERYKATHYTIHPVFKMRKEHFYLALKSLEMSAVSV